MPDRKKMGPVQCNAFNLLNNSYVNKYKPTTNISLGYNII